jgi:hypothetical protein
MAADYRLTGHRSQVIHRAGCPQLAKAQRSVGWPFGNGKTPEQIATEYGPTYDRLRFCQTCCPGASLLPYVEPLCAWQGCGKTRENLIHIREHGFVHPDDTRGRR